MKFAMFDKSIFIKFFCCQRHLQPRQMGEGVFVYNIKFIKGSEKGEMLNLSKRVEESAAE